MQERKHISLFLVFPHMNAYICMYVYMDLYIHIYTCTLLSYLFVDILAVSVGEYEINEKVEHSYL